MHLWISDIAELIEVQGIKLKVRQLTGRQHAVIHHALLDGGLEGVYSSLVLALKYCVETFISIPHTSGDKAEEANALLLSDIQKLSDSFPPSIASALLTSIIDFSLPSEDEKNG
jgi:hypothetical protein